VGGLMAIARQFADSVAQQNRNVAQQQNPYAQHVAQQVTREEFEALKKEVAALRALVTASTIQQGSNKSRAAYYREYRKRSKE
jgi:hypothetical protein